MKDENEIQLIGKTMNECAKDMWDDIKDIHPNRLPGMLLGAWFAPFLLAIDDSAFFELMQGAKRGCGEPECDCQQIKATLFEALSVVRDWAQEQKDRLTPKPPTGNIELL